MTGICDVPINRYSGTCEWKGFLDSLGPSTELVVCLVIVGLFLTLCAVALISRARRR